MSPKPVFFGIKPEAGTGVSLTSLLRRPRFTYGEVARFDNVAPDRTVAAREQAEISIKYEGYISQQQRQLDELRRMGSCLIPEGIDYDALLALRTEARQKLSVVRPRSLSQAARISGVSPADAAALMVYLQSC